MIVRTEGSKEGGVCAALWNHLAEFCVILHEVGRSPWQNDTPADCSYILFTAAKLICQARFPPLPYSASAINEYAQAQAQVECIVNLNEHTLPLQSTFYGQEFIHPLILTNTGGETQSGQVASAIILRGGGLVETIERAMRCVMIEFQFILAEQLRISNDSHAFVKTTGLDRLAEERCDGAFSKAMHAAQMEIANSTIHQVTCAGKECDMASDDYTELIAALQHHTKGVDH